MPRKAETPLDVRETLVRALAEGRTGALLGRTPEGERVTVYVMNGEVLACQAYDDDEQVLRRLSCSGVLDYLRVEQLRTEMGSGEPLSSLLYDAVAEEALQPVLFDRFRENLYRFLGGRSTLQFEPMETVFVDNLQFGHDSRALVEELIALREELAPLENDLDRVVQPGAGTVTSDAQVRFVELCADGVPLAELLDTSPFEASETLRFVRDMLDSGTLESDAPPRDRLALPTHSPVPDPAPEPTGRWMSAPGDVESMLSDGDNTAWSDLDEHTEEVDRSRYSRPFPASAARLLSPDAGDLDAFADHDHQRSDGSFVSARQHLDRVELGVPRTRRTGNAEMVVVEMEEADTTVATTGAAVSLNFQGRRLSDADVRRKIEVVNDVMATVVDALDLASGGGVGLSRVQVLVEGTAGPNAALFSNVELLPGGRFPVERVLRNLKKRPEGERRHLLNRAMSDVIERCLSLADEALDQRGMERMLEQIAGYQQRMGL